jgi:dihydrofolate reductase
VAEAENEISLEDRMRKIIAELALSADGFIARKDGSYDWLDRPSPKGHYGLDAFVKTIDTVVWGRKTYDQALGAGSTRMFGPKIKNYVFTHRRAKPDQQVEFVKEDVGTFVRRLRAEPGKNIWLMGGGGLFASFLDAGCLDEFSLHVIPVMIGEGIPLLAPARRTAQLKLISTKRFSDGVVHLNYRVLKNG